MSTAKRKARWAAGAALALPILVLAAPFLFTARSLHGVDFEACYRPLFVLARESLARNGEFPLWNPYQYAGVPYLGNAQANLYYPPNLLFLALPLEVAFELFVVLHLLLAAGGMYRLTRNFRLSRPACVVAGIAFSISYPAIARVWAGHITLTAAMSLTPLVISLLLATLKKPTSVHAAALAAATAALLVSGHPQLVSHAALLCAAVLIWRLADKIRRRESWLRPGIAALGGALLGVVIAAAHLAPCIEVARFSTRSAAAVLSTSPDESMIPLDLAGIASPVLPRALGVEQAVPGYLWHEKAIYFGVLPLIFAIAAVPMKRSGPVFFFAAVAVIALLHAASLLPGFGAFRVPARVAWIAVLCLATLAAFGADGLLRGARHPALMAAFVAILVGTDLCAFGLARLKVVDRTPAPAWYAPYIGEEKSDYRVLDLTRVEVAEGFRLLRGCGYPIPKSLAAFHARAWLHFGGPEVNSLGRGVSVRDPDILRALNVRWIVAQGPPLHPDWKPVATHDGLTLYEDSEAWPFALLETGTVEWSRPGINRIDVTARAMQPGALRISETWMPGWRGAAVAPEQDGLMRVDLPAGTSKLSLVYDPPARRIGGVVSAGGFLLLAGLLIVAAAARKRIESPHE